MSRAAVSGRVSKTWRRNSTFIGHDVANAGNWLYCSHGPHLREGESILSESESGEGE